MSPPKKKGELSEAKVLSRILELGHVALLPWGDSAAFDLVYIVDGEFVKAQVKTGHVKNNAIRFKTHIWNPFRKEKSTYIGKVNEFLVYCPDNDLVYRVPIEECGTNHAFLRLTKSKNNQKIKVKFAEDYVF